MIRFLDQKLDFGLYLSAVGVIQTLDHGPLPEEKE